MPQPEIKKKVIQKSIKQIHKKKIIIGVFLIIASLLMLASVLIENILERKMHESIKTTQDKQSEMEEEFNSFKKIQNIENKTIKSMQKIDKKHGFIEPITKEDLDNLALDIKNALKFQASVEIKTEECANQALKNSKSAKCNSITISTTSLADDKELLNLDSLIMKKLHGFVAIDKIEILKQSQYGDHIEYSATLSYKWIYFELIK